MDPIVVDGIVDIPLAGHPLGMDADAEQGPCPVLAEFVAGPENSLVQVAVRAVLGRAAGDCPDFRGNENGAVPFEPPSADRYNPLVLYGPSGTGKSHLVRGLLAEWKARYPRRRAVYTTAVDFARQLSDAVATQATSELHARYRRAALLVVEDIGLLAVKRPDKENEKRLAQEELLHTIDRLLASGGRVVITASAAPAKLHGFMPALQSRLFGGLIVPLCAPGPATRLAVLLRLAKLHQITLSNSAAQTLAEGLHGTVPELTGALLQLDMSARLARCAIDVASVRDYLAERSSRPQPQLRDIACATARVFSVKMADLRGPSRSRAAVTARDVAMYLARQLAGKSLQEIGRYFGHRDHTTVMHGCRQTQRLLKSDPAIRHAIEQLEQRWRKPKKE